MYRLPPEGIVDKLNPRKEVLENGNLLLENRYEFLNTVGRGNFGEVKKCLDKKSDLYAAVKIYHTGALLRKKEFSNDSSGRIQMKSALDRVYSEFSLLTHLPEDRSWVRPSHVFQTEGKNGEIYMVAEYVKLGALMIPVKDARDPFQYEITPLRNQLRGWLNKFSPSDVASVEDVRNLCGNLVKSEDRVRNVIVDPVGDICASDDSDVCEDKCEEYEVCEKPNVLFRSANVLPTEEVVKCFVKDVGEALMKLHKLKIAHRDVKPDNILLSEDGHAKLADFSSASETDGNFRVFGSEGTHCFYPPECCVVQENPQAGCDGRAADMWAVGVTMWCLLWGQVPFHCDNLDGLFKSIAECKYRFPTTGLSDEGGNALEQLLHRDPAKRMSASQLMEHRWIVSANPSAATDYVKTIITAEAAQ